MPLTQWLRRRPAADRALLLLATAAVVPFPMLWPTAESSGSMTLWLFGPFLGLQWMLQIAILAVAARIWAGSANTSVVRCVMALSLLASPLLTMAPGAWVGLAWILLPGVAMLMVIELPSVRASVRLRRAVRATSASFIVGLLALVALAIAWGSPDQANLITLVAWLALSVCTEAFAGWAVWRVLAPPQRDSLTSTQVIVPLAAVLTTEAVLVILVIPGHFDFLTVAGILILPVVGLFLVVREFVVDSRARRLSRILKSQESPSQLETVLGAALGDPDLRLVLRVGHTSRFVDTAGKPVSSEILELADTVPVRTDGEVIAVVLPGRRMMTSTVRGSVLLGVAKLAVEKAQLQATVLSQLNDIAESRRRLVHAADRARRAVERDLHDGAQQRLAALLFSLRLIADSTSSERLADFARDSAVELRAALAELQDLARGIHPAVLTDLGLAAAVESLAKRSPCPVVVDIPPERFDPTIELTAYFVVAEGLANTTKYAAASLSEVRITRRDDVLHIVVADDGVGATDYASGSGLQGLSDRVAAIGGTLIAGPRHGGGTIVVADVPLGSGPSKAAVSSLGLTIRSR